MVLSFKDFVIVVLCCVFNTSINSQVLHGNIKDFVSNNPLTASLTIYEIGNSIVKKEFVIVRNGIFTIILKKDYKIISIITNSSGYISDTIKIINPIKGNKYEINFQLQKETITHLNEVILIAKREKFEIKKDTISYNVSNYRDGSEQKIEDIIKKLPGIEVNNSSGEIKYKGKSIETVTLDGDNLFGSNYSLGTKNINVDLVEKVDAIDNYSENPLLKGIEQGDKVALNLKLKKQKLNFSKNIDLSTGYIEGLKQALDLKINVLAVSKFFKSYATLSYNNVGINNTPFDYFGFNLNIEQLKEQAYFAEKIIPETRISNLLDNRRTNINNQLFVNYNSIFKLYKKLSIKTNLYYLQDKIITNQLFENQYQINNQNFTTTDNTFITKKPQQYRGDLQIKHSTSKTSLLEYNLRTKQENIETPTQIIKNQSTNLFSSLKTEDFYIKQDLLWTKKISDKKALQLSLFHSFNNLPQTYSITPSLFNENTDIDNQESNFKKTFIEGKASYLGSGKRDKYSFTLGGNLNNSPFASSLFNSVEIIAKNDFDYVYKSIFTTGFFNLNRGKWQITPSYSISLITQSLKDNIENKEMLADNYIFQPALKLKYLLNSISFFTLNLGYNQNANGEQYFFLNQVLVDNRTTITNIPSLDIQKSQKYSLLYFNNDLYNQFQLNANISYQKYTGNFFTNSSITENTTQIEYFFLPQDNSNWNMNMQASKYFPFLESTIKLNSSYSLSNFKNIVNNSTLRENKSRFLTNELFWKTALNFALNFENVFTWMYSVSKSENQQSFINTAVQNSFKIIAKSNKKWFIIISSDYYLPRKDKKNNAFIFIDATLKHSPKSKKWEASLVLRNLTNEENFERIHTSDISTTIFKSNLLPRYYLFNLSWNF